MFISENKTVFDAKPTGFPSGGPYDVTSKTNITPNTWYHIVVTYDFITKNMSLYINGVLDNSDVRGSGSPPTYSSPLRIGKNAIGPTGVSTSFFNGTIDEVRIYNRTLSRQQIAINYNNGKANYNVLYSEETQENDNVQACVTPNDGTQDGETKCSGGVVIGAASSCGVVNSNFILLNDISLNGTCFTINASDIEIDCAGYTIRGKRSGYGMLMNQLSGVKIKNCIISNFSSGIYFNYSTAGVVDNNTLINNLKDGIGVLYSPSCNVTNNNIQYNGNYGIEIYNSSYARVINNNILSSGWDGLLVSGTISGGSHSVEVKQNTILNSTWNGFTLQRSNYSVIENNIIKYGAQFTYHTNISHNVVDNNSGDGLYARNGNGYITFLNNTFNNNDGYGLYLRITANHNLVDNFANYNGYDGFYLRENNYTSLINNTAKYNGWNGGWYDGFYLYKGYHNNLTANIAENNDYYGFYIWSGHNNTLVNNAANNNFYEGITVDTSHNATLIGNRATNNSNDLYVTSSNNVRLIDQLNSINYSFVSAGLDFEETGKSRLKFLTSITESGSNLSDDIKLENNSVFVNSTRRSGLNQSANITLYSLGFLVPEPIIDLEDDGSFVSCSAPQCNNLSYSGGTFVFNVSSFTTYSSQETVLGGGSGGGNGTTCGPINTSITLSANVSANTTCYTLNASSIVLDCNNYTIFYGINGSANSYGVYASSVNNVTVKNCYLIDINSSGTQGVAVNFADVDNSFVLANRIYTNSTTQGHGIEFSVTPDNNLVDANLIYAYGQGGQTDGILFSGTSSNNTLSSNIIRSNSSGFGNMGIVFSGALHAENTVIWNDIITDGAPINNNGMDFSNFWSNNVSFNNITAGGGSANIGINLAGGSYNHFDFNRIVTSGGTASHGINVKSSSSDNWFDGNTINTSGVGAYGVYVSGSNNLIFNNTLLSNVTEWIYLSLGAPSNFSNTTFNMQDGEINFQGLFAVSTPTVDINKARLNITYNVSYLNSSALSLLNQSAKITLRGLNFTNPEPIVDFTDSGSFVNCSAPQCNEISYNNLTGDFVFNVSSFTTYASHETPVSSPTTGGGGGGGGCSDTTWNCTAWGSCINGQQNRSCVSNCRNTRVENTSCICIPNWSCTSYGDCIYGKANRTCNDLNGCNTSFGKPSESEDCEFDGCRPNYMCGEWGDCNYNNNANDIIGGNNIFNGVEERECYDANYCAKNYTDSANCTSNIEIETRQEEECNRDILTLFEKDKQTPLTTIDIDSIKLSKLDVAFIQKKVEYCDICYDGLQDGFETGVDCGGTCKECKPEGIKIPAVLISSLLILMILVLLVPMFKMSRADSDLMEEIRKLIKSGETALKEKDRKKAETDFRKMKWLYIQMDKTSKKKIILKEMQNYHKKIKTFSEF